MVISTKEKEKKTVKKVPTSHKAGKQGTTQKTYVIKKKHPQESGRNSSIWRIGKQKLTGPKQKKKTNFQLIEPKLILHRSYKL